MIMLNVSEFAVEYCKYLKVELDNRLIEAIDLIEIESAMIGIDIECEIDGSTYYLDLCPKNGSLAYYIYFKIELGQVKMLGNRDRYEDRVYFPNVEDMLKILKDFRGYMHKVKS